MENTIRQCLAGDVNAAWMLDMHLGEGMDLSADSLPSAQSGGESDKDAFTAEWLWVRCQLARQWGRHTTCQQALFERALKQAKAGCSERCLHSFRNRLKSAQEKHAAAQANVSERGEKAEKHPENTMSQFLLSSAIKEAEEAQASIEGIQQKISAEEKALAKLRSELDALSSLEAIEERYALDREVLERCHTMLQVLVITYEQSQAEKPDAKLYHLVLAALLDRVVLLGEAAKAQARQSEYIWSENEIVKKMEAELESESGYSEVLAYRLWCRIERLLRMFGGKTQDPDAINYRIQAQGAGYPPMLFRLGNYAELDVDAQLAGGRSSRFVTPTEEQALEAKKKLLSEEKVLSFYETSAEQGYVPAMIRLLELKAEELVELDDETAERFKAEIQAWHYRLPESAV